MRRLSLSVQFITLISLVCCSAHLVAQQSRDADRFRWAETNPPCTPGPNQFCGADLESVKAALESPDALWTFITNPETDYFDRLVAASRGGKIFPASWIPKLLAAQAEVENPYVFGIDSHPFNSYSPKFGGNPRKFSKGETQRRVLGYIYAIPEQWIDYPLTKEELRHSPWPFQVSQALTVLYSSIVIEGDPVKLESAAVELPCDTPDSVTQFVKLTTAIATNRKFASSDVFGAWLNILRNSKVPRPPREHIMAFLSQISVVSHPRTQVLALEALDLNYQDVIRQAAYFDRKPYTLILASARFLLRSGVNQQRSSFGEPVTPQYRADLMNYLRYAMANEMLPERVKGNDEASAAKEDFISWFQLEQARLEMLASREAAEIDRASRGMSSVTICRTN